MRPKFQKTDGCQNPERNDCTVLALSNAAGISYEEAYDIMRTGSARKPNQCATMYTGIWEYSRRTGHHVGTPGEHGHLYRGMTIAQFLKLKVGGRFIIRIRSRRVWGKQYHHVFAVVNGVELDRNPNPRRARILAVWKFA